MICAYVFCAIVVHVVLVLFVGNLALAMRRTYTRLVALLQDGFVHLDNNAWQIHLSHEQDRSCP